ncbi:hypothetical protein EGYY_21960 [Eggerthella sp. YY7918]|nr:hypothetical protein EGYY_21960 [Eggerthella sp. YY7918]
MPKTPQMLQSEQTGSPLVEMERRMKALSTRTTLSNSRNRVNKKGLPSFRTANLLREGLVVTLYAAQFLPAK